MKKSLKYTAIGVLIVCIGYTIYDYISDGVLDTDPIPILVITIGSSLALFNKEKK
jgi:hypothetical protein|tara:strand:+ start:315 stop:479 length:165 start_codon:yes stop_codon:yes gene_type:complete